MAYNFPRETIEQVVDWYRRGDATATDVAEHLGCSVNTAISLLKDQGVEIRSAGRRPGSGRPPSERVQAYIEAYKEGHRPAEIARKYGVTRQAVHAALAYRGVLEKRDGKEEGAAKS